MTTSAAEVVLGAIQVLGVALRIGAGRWSDSIGERIGHIRRFALLTSLALAVVAACTGAPLPVVVISLIIAGSLSMGVRSPLVHRDCRNSRSRSDRVRIGTPTDRPRSRRRLSRSS